MARIFDNIEQDLLGALRATLAVSSRADFCVGYLNLRGWQAVDDLVQPWSAEAGQICRVLVDMQRPPYDEIREFYRAGAGPESPDLGAAARLKNQFAAHLREQITLGIPTGKDEAALRTLAHQLRAGQVVIKLFLPYPLHAKLYLLFRNDVNNPITGFVGSSNLTLQGLARQGELNVDVLDHHATQRLSQWFENRWGDRWALDVSADLAEVIETSWAREQAIPPYHIYLNIAFHLSTEARAGLSQFRLPARFEEDLFEFQKSAVKIAARHLHRRGGVMIGDVVGLGKTMMATALARMFEDDLGFETLIICPRNLEPMWERYRTEYGLRGTVLPISQVTRRLPDLKRYRLVLIDESHNLRNREGRRYKAIADYIRSCDAKVILLTATPYNKTKTDLSSQLRLFIDEKANIGLRPEHFMRKHGIGEAEFERKHQCKVNSILAIEKSDEFDDWRELIRLYMVRRTRSFIVEHYTLSDDKGRRYLSGKDGTRSYFPVRKPLSLKFTVDETDPQDRFAKLYSSAIVDTINALYVPRYGLGNYLDPVAEKTATATERKFIENLGRAGKRLMGFCRTNLFKRQVDQPTPVQAAAGGASRSGRPGIERNTHGARSLGRGTRPQTCRAAPPGCRHPCQEQGTGVHPVCRHGPLSWARTWQRRCDPARSRHRRLRRPLRVGLPVLPALQQQERDQSRRTARIDLHRRPVGRPEPAGLQHGGQFRSALGDHPPHPAGRPG